MKLPILNAILCSLVLCLILPADASATVKQSKGSFEDKFRQLDEVLPTPNGFRSASGQPGHQYWQQKVDYQIDAILLENERRIEAKQKITYSNNSPDTMNYLWVQLDQNIFKNDSMAELTTTFSGPKPVKSLSGDDTPSRLSFSELKRMQFQEDNALGYQITRVETAKGEALEHVIVGTLMRVDLPKPLKTGDSVSFEIDFAFNIVDQKTIGARSGYEHFPDDEREGGNDIFQLAQWFPRLAAYTDYEAWTNKEFIGQGEFTLEFGNYDVSITVPADHIVASTGVLQNPRDVLSKTQRERLKQAEDAERTVFIVTEEEALANEKEGTDKTKTWRFEAKNVRDFAWSSSRKFIWDARGYNQKGNDQELVMAMSFYPKEGGDLWKKYSTESIIHTMKVYSRFTFDYPYPVAQSINGPVFGMEYPMITFNGPRPTKQEDGSYTYSLATKSDLIRVIIHEIGHIYFPMIVNTDERQWTWMDEGINSFLDGVAAREWDADIPWGWGMEPREITDYMQSQNQMPVMTQSDSISQFFFNSYAKPSVALTILRETVLGRELFDFAFREFARRWKFKRPTPADFFRTMEEASGVDLDWFWRGWFYSTDHVDISLDSIYKLNINTANPDIDFSRERQEEANKPTSISVQRNKQEGIKKWVERFDDVTDFYDENDRFTVTNAERNAYKQFLDSLDPSDKKAFERALEEDKNYYAMYFSNLGGLVMPILLEFTYEDGSAEMMKIPAEIWRKTPNKVSKLIVTDKDKIITSVAVDPYWETTDVDIKNNYYPRRIIPSRIEAFKSRSFDRGKKGRDIMQDSKTDLIEEDDDTDNEENEIDQTDNESQDS